MQAGNAAFRGIDGRASRQGLERGPTSLDVTAKGHGRQSSLTSTFQQGVETCRCGLLWIVVVAVHGQVYNE